MKWRTWNSQLPVVFSIFFLTPNILFYANQKQLFFFSGEFSSIGFVNKKSAFWFKHLANSPHGDLVATVKFAEPNGCFFFPKMLKNGECPSSETWILKPPKLWRNVLCCQPPQEMRVELDETLSEQSMPTLECCSCTLQWPIGLEPCLGDIGATFPKINLSHKNFIVLD